MKKGGDVALSEKGKLLGLKIDVDTYLGMKRGVPRLLDILNRFGLRGTFFLSFGPDASGRALFQLLKNPLFLKKMTRTNAGRLYGIRTALYGVLLPSPDIALRFPSLVRRIVREGHEVEFHAWDHRRWQDDLPGRSREWIARWFGKGIEAYEALLGRKPEAFGAPGWVMDDRVLETLAPLGFSYLSCTRAKEPFLYESLGIPEIPSDLPCLEEGGLKKGPEKILRCLVEGTLHVLPVHAEMEGGVGAGAFAFLIREAADRGYAIGPLSHIRNRLSGEVLPVRNFRMERLPGRAFPCAV